MKILLKPLFWLSVAGLILTLIVHVLAMMRIVWFSKDAVSFVIPALLLLVGPLALFRERLTQSNGIEWRNKLFLPNTPPWFKYALATMVVYFGLTILFLATWVAGAGQYADTACFSAFLLVALSNCSANLWCMAYDPAMLEKKKCPNGHEMLRFAKYCGHCGAQLSDEHDAKANH